MSFSERYNSLNANQKAAVDKIYGPLLVIAGPGTGKTELLSVRAANILQQTDALPSNILCLTFTDNGAANMRERLRQIIGEQAYKVAIHTFHSFGVEIINQNREYFFQGSDFQPADDLSQYQVLKSVFDSLNRQNPLAVIFDGEYHYLKTLRSMISEFKKSGLSTDELKQIINDNQQAIDQLSEQVSEVLGNRITTAVIEPFARLAQTAAGIEGKKLPNGIPSYTESLSVSMALAVKEAAGTGKTNSITTWKGKYCTKNSLGDTVLKDSLQTSKLLAAVDVYEAYTQSLHQAKLYDYDDMILTVIQAMKKHPDLVANLIEKFQFIMVDEFQDTNLAQLRLLFSLTDYDQPNVMAVGDDDQAIFSFQGADVGNISRFRKFYQDPEIVVLTDNYRSDSAILAVARQVIKQGQDRLENTIPDLSKELTPWFSHTEAQVDISEYVSEDTERAGVANRVADLIKQDVPAESIAILAREHKELIALLPHLAKAGVKANYERRDDALEHELVKLIEKLARVIVSARESRHDDANSLLPELLAHPAWGFTPIDIWKLSLNAYKNRQHWLEAMQTSPVFEQFSSWLVTTSIADQSLTVEQQIDHLIGVNEVPDEEYRSPIYEYYFSRDQLTATPDIFISAMEALRTIRDQVRAHFNTDTPTLADFLALIDSYRQMDSRLTIVRNRAEHLTGRINMMTAHKSKGLEFDFVFIIGATDDRWGEKARGRSRSISYPINLPLEPAGSSYDERIRLFFVAMTRAKQSLNISYSSTDRKSKTALVASFISQQPITLVPAPENDDTVLEIINTDWHDRLTNPLTSDLRELLAPKLESYKLSVTHLNNFLDVPSGGPQAFLINNLLQFPHAKSAKPSLGTAVHSSLQFAHNAMRANNTLPDLPELLDHFSDSLREQGLSEHDFMQWDSYGRTVLEKFMTTHGSSFHKNQQAELNFVNQGVVINGASLTGKLDLIDADKEAKTIQVTDYKTGKSFPSWKGSTDSDKIRLHKYRQQLMFYQLLSENSRDYADYSFTGGVLQFTEADAKTGEIYALKDSFTRDELDVFAKLIGVVWHKITTLDLPDISKYSKSYKGILAFEQELLDNNNAL